MHEFLNFEAFYALGLPAFKRPLDPLLVFCHYVIVQNEYKYLRAEDEKRSELLPAGWNELNEEDEIHMLYEKRGCREKIQLEAAFEDDGHTARLTFRKLVGALVSRVYLKIADYINQEDYKSRDLNETFKQKRFYKLFVALMHGLAKISATAQPFELTEPAPDPKLSTELDKYAYESQDDDETAVRSSTVHVDHRSSNQPRIPKRKRRSFVAPSWGIKRRRLSRSSSTFLSTERDPLSVLGQQPEAPSAPEVEEEEEEEEEEPMVVEPAKPVTPKKADPGGHVTLTSWFKKLTPPTSAERVRHSQRTLPKPVGGVNPITNYYSRSAAAKEMVKPAKYSDIKLLSKCVVKMSNIFPHGLGRASNHSSSSSKKASK